MTREARRRKWRWLRHVAWVLAAKIFLIFLALMGMAIFFGSGAGNPIIQRVILRRLENMTGGHAELSSLSIRWFALHIRLTGLVIHGNEPAGTEPLFAADEVQAGLRIDSFWGRKFSLSDLLIQAPRVHIRVERNGTSNVPALRGPSRNKPAPETLFDLRIRHVELLNGWVLYNDIKTPLALEGRDLRLALDASGSAQQPVYLGTLDWQSVHFTAKRFLPLPTAISAKFTLSKNSFTLEQGVFAAGRSHLDAQAELQDFSQPKWTFRYRGWVNLLDFRETLRSPETPTGLADVHGEGSFAGGQLHGTGNYSGHDIVLTYPIFRASGVSSRGSFQIDNKGLEVPDFMAGAFGGTVKGRVTMLFDGLKFRAATHVQDMRLAAVLPAIERIDFPVNELHWDSLIAADTIQTWSGPFEHFEISGSARWSSPNSLAPGHIPMEGDWKFRYRYDGQLLTIQSGEFDTSASRVSVSGVLTPRATDLNVHFETGALEGYRDFINAIRSTPESSRDAVRTIAGTARWDGTIIGPSGAPTFTGHVRGEAVRYEGFVFDSLEGDLTYSPDVLTFARGHARRGTMDAAVELKLALSHWSFGPRDPWSADVNLDATPIDAVQEIFGWSYPVKGQLSGQFHGRGTRKSPTVTGLFDLASGDAYGVSFNRLRGQLDTSSDEARIANAELRLFPPEKEPSQGAGIVTGSVGYNFVSRAISVELVGASLPLANLAALQSPRFPLAGQVSFHLKASGSPMTPQGEGNFRVVDFRIGQAGIGSFDGHLASDGHTAHLDLSSSMTTGEISGGYTLGLTDPYPLDGKVSIRNIDLDPFLLTALHLQLLNAHGKADGEIAVNGGLKHPESIVVDARFSRLLFNYANVQLENAGPVHLRSSRDTLQIEPAEFRGPDTDIRIGGNVGFSDRRALSMRLNGGLNLRLLTGIAPGLTGTPQGGVLSGRITIQRVSLAQGLEVAGVLVSAKQGISGPSTASPFLRNLQFDIEALSTPDARMEWPGAELDAEANIRVRGTWEHPILLGHIHVLSGDLLFHGNRYRVARGDINFANPFRLDPVVNVEASTNIQQYEITLNFNGPASKLTLAYRSDPPLPANDIVTLLALGQTSSEATVRSAGATQSGTTGASAILSEAISSQLSGRLEKLFGITSFRVDPALAGVGSTGSSQNAAARVTVQQQVTRNLTVTYVSNVGSTQQQVIQVEYNVNRNVSIVGLRDYNGTFGIDVKIKNRFP